MNWVHVFTNVSGGSADRIAHDVYYQVTGFQYWMQTYETEDTDEFSSSEQMHYCFYGWQDIQALSYHKARWGLQERVADSQDWNLCMSP